MTDVSIAKLTQPFPKAAIKQRQGGGGKSLSYVETHTVIHRLNDATMNRWDFRLTRLDQVGDLYVAVGELTIPGLGTRTGIGVQRVVERSGEDLVKGAASDCLKKCATLFGVGLELYGPDYEGNAPATEKSGSQRAAPPRGTQDATPQDKAAPGTTSQATSAKDRADDYRKTQNAHYHATATDHGLSEAAQHLYALTRFPDRTGDHTSRSQLTGQELHDLALQVKDDMVMLGPGKPPPTVDYANRIAAAIDRAELSRIAAEMKANGVATDWLRAMWKRRNDEVPAMVMVAETRVQGESGADKWTT